jgi:magnesium chelatase subunit D
VRGSSRSALRRDRRQGASRRTASRTELAARHAAFADVSPGVGRLDRGALDRLLARDPDAAATLLADLALATDRELADAARRLAARVFVRFAGAGTRPSRGTRRLGPGTVSEGDLDLDRTLGRLSGTWPPPEAELVTRSWRAHRRALCLLIDTSGSMSGLAVAIAAVAAASVVLAAGQTLDPAVVAFGGGVTVLRAAGARRDPGELAGELIGLRGHGLTNLAGALRAAAGQLARAPADERVAVLLSDCVATTGGDPAAALAGIDRLHVLCPRLSPEATSAAAALARAGGGISQPVTTLAQVAPALTAALARSY